MLIVRLEAPSITFWPCGVTVIVFVLSESFLITISPELAGDGGSVTANAPPVGSQRTTSHSLQVYAIVFTGGVSNSFNLIEGHIRRAMHARAFAPPLAQLPLLVSRLGEHAGVIGAAHLP